MANIFGFGSNTQGRHGAGDALIAREQHGAVYGQAMGLQGNSWAIITKDLSRPKHLQLRSVPLPWIEVQVKAMFYAALTKHKDDTFNMCAIGCGRAGYTPEEIAPMFKDAPSNVVLPQLFLNVLNRQS
jgi:hypothetical protein